MSIILVKIAIKEIRFPQLKEYTEPKERFLKYSNNWGLIFEIDGTHINISKPNISKLFDYYDRKGNFSVNFVCFVDYKQSFRVVSYGFRKCHDARIYRGSHMRTLIKSIRDLEFFVI
ncbi:hypothetical protein CDIK_3510 [Cucumispora dikerogammari]|nr:hypothetical protein CDIK_3510 [Cucumispora dikerogammari]